jgi:hypothetical protein
MAIDMTDCVIVLSNSIHVYDQSLSIVKKTSQQVHMCNSRASLMSGMLFEGMATRVVFLSSPRQTTT